jgi:RNA polymerase sigma-70 factor (ECF subfamily)
MDEGRAPHADATLAARFRDRDPDAVRQVYREYGRAVYGVAYRALGNPGLAEEAAQQAFLQAWRASATVDASREIGPWLFTIAKRAAIDVYRREARRSHEDVDALAPGDPAVVTLPPNIERLSENWEIHAAVDGLPADERDVVRLQHFGGLTHLEIADRLDIPVGTVKSRSFRAHRRLAASLGHLQEVQA